MLFNFFFCSTRRSLRFRWRTTSTVRLDAEQCILKDPPPLRNGPRTHTKPPDVNTPVCNETTPCFYGDPFPLRVLLTGDARPILIKVTMFPRPFQPEPPPTERFGLSAEYVLRRQRKQKLVSDSQLSLVSLCL